RLSTGALPRFGGHGPCFAWNPRAGHRPRHQLRLAGNSRELYPPRRPHRTRRRAWRRFHSIHKRPAIRIVPVGAYARHADGEAGSSGRSARTQGPDSGRNGFRLIRAGAPNGAASRRSPASANGGVTSRRGYGASRRRLRRHAWRLAALFCCYFEQLTTRNCYNTFAAETRSTVTPEGIGTTRVQVQRGVKSGFHGCHPYSVLILSTKRRSSIRSVMVRF